MSVLSEFQRATECAKCCQWCLLQKGIRLTSLSQPACQLTIWGRGESRREGGREGDVCCGRIETDEKKVGKEEREKELIQESETDEGGDVVPGHCR